MQHMEAYNGHSAVRSAPSPCQDKFLVRLAAPKQPANLGYRLCQLSWLTVKGGDEIE